jgi:hypothetical protein
MPTRETYIAAEKPALVEALIRATKVDDEASAGLRELSRLLAAVFHYETFERLERLRALYRPLDPNEKNHADADPTAFMAEFEKVLAMASFMELPVEVLSLSAASGMVQDIKLKTSEAGVQRIRFFARGARTEKITLHRWWGLYKKQIDGDIIDDVIVILEMKPRFDDAEARTLKRIKRGARTGAVLLKHFADVPRSDLMTLHPGASPTMKRTDQLILGVPAVAGGVPLLTQLIPALGVIFAVIAAYFGVDGHIDNNKLKQAVAAVSGFVALGAFLMRQRLKFKAQQLQYQKQLADTVYFHTIANNVGVLDGLIGAAETQDTKEAIAAYATLLSAGAMTKTDLDKAVEEFLRKELKMDVDFEIGDAMAKLERFKLVAVQGEFVRAAPLPDALAALDEAWDGFFTHRRAGAHAT